MAGREEDQAKACPCWNAFRLCGKGEGLSNLGRKLSRQFVQTFADDLAMWATMRVVRFLCAFRIFVS